MSDESQREGHQPDLQNQLQVRFCFPGAIRFTHVTSGEREFASVIRVAFVTSHPIQYQIPVFRYLAARPEIDFQVLFAMLPDSKTQGQGFGVAFEWDIPLLQGYNYRVLKNVSRQPGLTQFRGCDTPEIRSVLAEQKIDVVIVNGWVVKTCLQALRACRQLRIPCIVRGEANNLRPRPLWKRLIQRRLVRQYNAYLPIGTANREFYRSHGIADSQMFDSPYCIENERFSAAASAARGRRSEIRDRWSIPDNLTCFLFCGKFEQKKHPRELLESFRVAVAGGASASLLMVGDGELRSECELFAAKHSLPVTFAGFQNQSAIVDAYVASDVLVLPSDHGETWGLVVNEAMACGLPAVVSNQVGCAADLIQHGETGWIFPFGAWSELSRLLTDIAGEGPNPGRLQDVCSSKIRYYSPENAARGMLQAVKYAADRNKKNASSKPEIRI